MNTDAVTEPVATAASGVARPTVAVLDYGSGNVHSVLRLSLIHI